MPNRSLSGVANFRTRCAVLADRRYVKDLAEKLRLLAEHTQMRKRHGLRSLAAFSIALGEKSGWLKSATARGRELQSITLSAEAKLAKLCGFDRKWPQWREGDFVSFRDRLLTGLPAQDTLQLVPAQRYEGGDADWLSGPHPATRKRLPLTAAEPPNAPPQHLTVFISSTPNVFRERAAAKRVINEINNDPSWRAQFRLEPWAREDLEPSKMAEEQDVVDAFMRKASHADIVVCIFGDHLHTPTKDGETGTIYQSPTHYEVDSAYRAYLDRGVSPCVMAFLAAANYEPQSEVTGQISSMNKTTENRNKRNFSTNFKDQYFKSKKFYRGHWQEFGSDKAFEHLFRTRLMQHLNLIALKQWGDKFERHLDRLIKTNHKLELFGIREAERLRIDLEKVYVALKADPRPDLDRQEAARLHELEVREMANVPSMDNIEDRLREELDAQNIRETFRRPDRRVEEDASAAEAYAKSDRLTRNLGDVVRRHRRVVIRGEPGSGKTTLGRWVMLQFSRAMKAQMRLDAPIVLEVEKRHIDPDFEMEADKRTKVQIGPPRLPVYLRIAHYARELARCEDEHKPSTSVIEFLGRDPDSGSLGDGMSAETRNTLIKGVVERDQAIIVLDGLDELNESNRYSVVKKIEEFIREVTLPEGGSIPASIGGNQVILTSRYTGYDSCPIQAGCAHYDIERMTRPLVEQFAHAWAAAVNCELDLEREKPVNADELIKEIYNPGKPAIRELASNPLLVTILATVHWTHGSLPEQRSGLYYRLVENLLRIWLRRPECREQHLTREELLVALEPLAAEMQTHSVRSGLVSLSRIAELVSAPLAHSRNMLPDDRNFLPVKNALIAAISTQVGLLAEESPGNYAFIHRTFQEFLAARHMLANLASAAFEIKSRLSDPLWREPVLLALGFAAISHEYGPTEKHEFFRTVLSADDEPVLLPRATLTVISAVPDLRGLNEDVVKDIVVRLVDAYARCMRQGRSETLAARYETALRKLLDSAQSRQVQALLIEIARKDETSNDCTSVIARIAGRLEWFTIELLEVLLDRIALDRSEFDWPIHSALAYALGRPDADMLGANTAFGVARLKRRLPLRLLLETDLFLQAWVQTQTDWLWLLLALYQCVDYSEPQNAVITDNAATGPEEAFTPSGQKRRKVPANVLPAFDPVFITHDLTNQIISQAILAHLVARKPARELLGTLRAEWQSANPACAAEAFVGLIALGEDPVALLSEALAMPCRSQVVLATRQKLSWLETFLRSPLKNSGDMLLRIIPDTIPTQRHYEILRANHEILNWAGASPIKISDTIPDFNFSGLDTAEARTQMRAEYWIYTFEQGSGEDVRDLLVHTANDLQARSEDILRSIVALPNCLNAQSDRCSRWNHVGMPYFAASPAEAYQHALDVLFSAPTAYDRPIGYLLGCCSALLKLHPYLRYELAEFLRTKPEPFHAALYQAPEGYVLTRRDLKALRREGLPQHVASRLSSLLAVTVPSQRTFLGLLRKTITPEEFLQFGKEILAQAAAPLRKLLPNFEGRLDCATESITSDQKTRITRISSASIESYLCKVEQNEFVKVLDLSALQPTHRCNALLMLLLLGQRSFQEVDQKLQECLMQIGRPQLSASIWWWIAVNVRVSNEGLVERTLRELEKICDSGKRAETLEWLRAASQYSPELTADLERAVQMIEDPWNRNRIGRRYSRLTEVCRAFGATEPLVWRIPSLRSGMQPRVYRQRGGSGYLLWGMAHLFAAARDGASTQPDHRMNGSNWVGLRKEDPCSSVTGLINEAIPNGLEVGADAIAILVQIVHEGKADSITELWPMLHCSPPPPVVQQWLGRSDSAGRWAALVMAENGNITGHIASVLVELLESGHDRLRFRAGLVLAGNYCYVDNLNRSWRTSRIPLEAWRAFGHRASSSVTDQGARTTLRWLFHNVHCDDAKLVKSVVADAQDGGPNADAAFWFLSHIESADADSLDALVACLPVPVPKLQCAIIHSLSKLAHAKRLPDSIETPIFQALTDIPISTRRHVMSLREGSAKILAICEDEAVLRARHHDEAIELARQAINAKREWLSDVAIQDKDSCISTLQNIGAGSFIWLNTHWKSASDAAASVKLPETVLTLLLHWLQSGIIMGDDHRDIGDILTAMQALARRHTPMFSRLAEPGLFEPVFSELALSCSHWTGRMAAMQLLGLLRRVNPAIAKAFRKAMSDVTFVSEAATEAAIEFRRVDGPVLNEMLELLDSPSANVAASTAKLLCSVANARSHAVDQQLILRSLESAALSSERPRPIYQLTETPAGFTRMSYSGQLDQVLFEKFFEISSF
jgi:hypothetical protein